MNNALVVDPSISGVSGDMLVAMLVDLGGDVKLLNDVVESLEKLPHVREFRVTIEDVLRSNVKAKWLKIAASEVRDDHVVGRDLIKWMDQVINDLGLEGRLRDLAFNVLNKLLKYESLIHNSTPHDVRLHEIGSADTIFDIVATIALMNDLGLINGATYSLPVAVGGGTVKGGHGLMPCPAYLTLEILKESNYYLVGGPIDEELTTPTGAALLTTLFKPIRYLPLMKVRKVGYGAGSKAFKGISNVLRGILGCVDDLNPLDYEEIYVIECNVDDVTGEILGHAINRMIELGALDASVISALGKKGRPSYIVKALSREETISELVKYMISELGTLGVRVFKVGRYVVPYRELRELSVVVDGREFKVRVKVSKDSDGRVIRVKPEFSDLESISKSLGIPVNDVIKCFLRQYSNLNLS